MSTNNIARLGIVVTACIVISITLTPSLTTVLGFSNNNINFFLTNSKGSTEWIKQCAARITNSNSNSAAAPAPNNTFALNSANTYCTRLLQAYINNNQVRTQNQPSLSSSSSSSPSSPFSITPHGLSHYPAYPYPSQYPHPSQYPYQQNPSYKSPYPYQSLPFLL